MILADRRFGRSEKFSKLPKWLRDNLGAGSTNLSVEESLAISKKFLRQMAQPFPREAQFGIRSVLWTSIATWVTTWASSRAVRSFLQLENCILVFWIPIKRLLIWNDWSAKLYWTSNKLILPLLPWKWQIFSLFFIFSDNGRSLGSVVIENGVDMNWNWTFKHDIIIF